MEEAKENVENAVEELVITKDNKKNKNKWTVYIVGFLCFLLVALIIYIYLRAKRW
jgi:uncharacterized integral membrane protein